MNSLPDNESRSLQQRATALIKPLIPPDAAERVVRAVKQFNAIVREHIRSETGLRLTDEKGRGSVPVRVVDGFPAAVARLIDQHQDRTLWRLILALPKLGGVVEGLALLIKNWDEFERWPLLPPVAKGCEPVLTQTVEVVNALQTLTVTKQVFEQLKQIHEDILGVYRFGFGVGSQIDLFWMAHALFAGAFGLRIEDLVVVTLAHELAHAYTHVGRDIDGTVWREPGFGRSDPEVVEGLAQFYTATVTQKLLARAPGAFPAYQKLLAQQSGPYRAHEEWLPGSPAQRGETVRFAMLRARGLGLVREADWLDMLEETKETLHTNS